MCYVVLERENTREGIKSNAFVVKGGISNIVWKQWERNTCLRWRKLGETYWKQMQRRTTKIHNGGKPV